MLINKGYSNESVRSAGFAIKFYLKRIKKENKEIQEVLANLPNVKREKKLPVILSKEEIETASPSLQKGIYALIASTGISRIIEDVSTDVTIQPHDIFSPDISSLIAVPFLRRGKVLGLICAFRDRPKCFQFSDLKLFNSVAEHLAIAMENARLFEKTKKMAITDGLTGLYNKRFFLEIMNSEVERARRCEHEMSFIIMDIDNFKHYNDTNGHPAGDVLLKELSALIKGSIRKMDIPCRYGGEEFVIILPETSKRDAETVARKLVCLINSHDFPHADTQPMGFISVSMGLSAFPQDDIEDEGLICKADEALYSAKTSGKNRVVLV